jgi:hypothetical protein
LFQKPDNNHNRTGRWYVGVGIGKNNLGDMLPKICRKANIGRFTNKCLQATAAHSAFVNQGVDNGDKGGCPETSLNRNAIAPIAPVAVIKSNSIPQNHGSQSSVCALPLIANII